MNFKVNKKIRTSDFLFFFGWFIFVASYTILKISEITYMFDASNLYKYFQILIGLIFSLKIIFVDKHSMRQLLIYFMAIVLFLLNAYFAKTEFLLFMLLIIIASNHVDFDQFVKFDVKIRIGLFFFIVFLSILGILPNFTRVINGTFKQALGFAHPNILCIFVVTILLELMYLNKKVNAPYLFFNLVVLILLYFICNSRTSIYSYILIFLIYIFVKDKEKFFHHKIISKILYALPFVFFLLSFVLILLYEIRNPFVATLNRILTTRISHGYRFFDLYGLALFGTEIQTVGTRMAMISGEDIATLDMGYLKLAINNGLLVSTVVVIFLSFLQHKALEKKNYKILLISTFFIIAGFAETNMYNVLFNISLLSIYYLMNSSQTKKE